MPDWLLPALGTVGTGLAAITTWAALTGRWTQRSEDRARRLSERIEALELDIKRKADAKHVFTKAEQLQREKEDRHEFVNQHFDPAIRRLDDGLRRHSDTFVKQAEFDREMKRVDRLERKVFNGSGMPSL